MKRMIFALIYLIITIPAFNQTISVEKYFEWYEKKHIIHNVTFANLENEIAFSYQFYIPDGGNAYGREKYIDSLEKVISKNPRFADPEVLILDLNSKKSTKIDFGWSPCFSPNDERLTYVSQNNPISGQRVLASTLKGNSIKIYNRKELSIKTLVTNEDTLLMNPLFKDSLKLVYQIGDAVNGAFAGSIGINSININNKTNEKIFTPRKSFGYYHIVGKVFNQLDTLAFLIYQPNDKGYMYMANEYKYLLANQKRTICDLGIRHFKNIDNQVEVDDNGLVTLIDDRKDLRRNPTNIILLKNSKELSRNTLTEEIRNAFISPDGSYLIYCNVNSELYFFNLKTQNKAKINLKLHELFGVYWSESSKNFAIVTNHENFIDTDIITIFRIK